VADRFSRSEDTDPGEFVIRVRRDPDAVVLELFGELDRRTARQLEHQLTVVLRTAEQHIVVDLSALERIDGAGVRTLLRVHRRCCARDIELTLLRGPPDVQHVLEGSEAIDVLAFDD
jgi:anti-anti-sigma factor